MDFKAYFNSPAHADLTLCFGPHKLPAHKLLLIQGSDYFKAMLNSQFAEARASSITLEDDRPEAVKSLISTFHGHAAYNKQAINSTADGLAELTSVIDLYVTASKYLVPTLCSQIVDDFPEMLEAVAAGKEYSVNVVRASQHVYKIHAGAADELRIPIVSIIVANISKWQKDEKFYYLIASQPELGVDIIRALAGAASQPSAKKSGKAAEVANAAENITVPRKRTRQR
ncbi:hypothetical protein LTS10_003485 [Elasticomyces elasticus]|nr:hypothetical protein LTS10_003485 [Elasticomyces elasticus]